MRIVYVHGLDSSANSVKGQLLESYCLQYYPEITVFRPDLNLSPNKVFQLLCDLVEQPQQTALIGSSLGGYFASLVSNVTGCPAIVLNPSTRPHISLQRFLDDKTVNANDEVGIYQTSGGWTITRSDLAWFDQHRLETIDYPSRLFVLIKLADELLDPQVAIEFYQAQGVAVTAQKGGDHRMTDFSEQLPMLMPKVLKMLEQSNTI